MVRQSEAALHKELVGGWLALESFYFEADTHGVLKSCGIAWVEKHNIWQTRMRPLALRPITAMPIIYFGVISWLIIVPPHKMSLVSQIL